jgi:uncharacterized protein YdhG (YjbR/CyaY superfamily)
MAKTNFESVADYIAQQPGPVRPFLRRVRATLKKALPRATEGISYQIPVIKLDDRMVLYFAGYERHYSIYPATPRLVAALGKELSGALFHKATLRFPVDRPVPAGLIARIARVRAAEVAKQAPTKIGKAAKKAPARKAAGARKATAKRRPKKRLASAKR